MSKISVTTIAGLTSGGDANKVKIESGDELDIVSGDLTVDTNVLKVDASNNRIIMGYTSGRVPTSVIVPHVNSSIAPAMRITTHGNAGYSSSNSQGAGARLEFGQYDDGYDWVTGSIASTRTGNNWGGDLIFSTNNNSASNNQTETMRINTNGQITTPSQPAFLARHTSTSFNNTGTITFNTVSANGGFNRGGHYNTSNGRFTAPVAGVYAFTVHLISQTSITNGQMKFQVNGSDYQQYHVSQSATDWYHHSFQGIFNLSASDYVSFKTQEQFGIYGQQWSGFAGCLLG